VAYAYKPFEDKARVGRFPQAQAAYESAWSTLQRVDNPAAAIHCPFCDTSGSAGKAARVYDRSLSD